VLRFRAYIFVIFSPAVPIPVNGWRKYAQTVEALTCTFFTHDYRVLLHTVLLPPEFYRSVSRIVFHTTKYKYISSSAIAETPRCRVGQLWPKVEDDILQTT